ncbi:MAG: hypothetical protein JNM14_12605 [Ferruginibacter sp.]|nr:hypothetical protein [Ferruginibacter sp.]
MGSKKKIVIVFILLAAIAATAIYFVWNKPHKNVEDAAAVEVKATDLYDFFIKDSVKANAAYTGKILQVTGQVEKVSVNQQAQNILLLKTAVAGAYINCTMEKNPDGIKPDDNVSIKGICSGYISGDAEMGLPGDVFMVRGYLLK